MVVTVMDMCDIDKLWVNVDGDIRNKSKSTRVGRRDCWRTDTGCCKVRLWSHVESVVGSEREEGSNDAIEPGCNGVALCTHMAVSEETREVGRNSEEVGAEGRHVRGGEGRRHCVHQEVGERLLRKHKRVEEVSRIPINDMLPLRFYSRPYYSRRSYL